MTVADLRCERLAKSYGTRAVLDAVNLYVPEGTVTAILGASGSGKTTLLRLIIGFMPPDAGVITVGGTVVADGEGVHVPAERRAIGYVAQEGALFPHLTVGENAAFGLPRAERKRSARIGEVLALVGLDQGYAGRRPHELSGGEQRRVALARAIAPHPRMVLLDEPFSGLDAALRVETRAAVLDALAREGTTAVLVTHDQAEALSTGREVAVLRGGRLVQTAAPVELYRTPVDLDVARFVGDAVVLAGTVESGTVACALGRLPARGPAPDGPGQVMARPEQIRLVAADEPGGVHGDAASGVVVALTYYGADTVVQVALADGVTSVRARVAGEDVPALGARVGIAVAGSVAVYPASDPPAQDPAPNVERESHAAAL